MKRCVASLLEGNLLFVEYFVGKQKNYQVIQQFIRDATPWVIQFKNCRISISDDTNVSINVYQSMSPLHFKWIVCRYSEYCANNWKELNLFIFELVPKKLLAFETYLSML